MPIEAKSTAIEPRATFVEAVLLAAVTPFLLFPARFPLLTAGALFLVSLIWCWPLLAERGPGIPSSPFALPLALFLAASWLATIVSVDPDLTLPKICGIILGFTLWRFALRHGQSSTRLRVLTGSYLLLALVITLVGFLGADWAAKASSRVPLLATVTGTSSGPWLAFSEAGAGVHPNQLAGAILLYLPLLVSLLAAALGRAAWPRRRLLLALSSVLAGLALLLTQSRSGWLGALGGLFVLGLLWWMFMAPSPKRHRFGTVLVIIAASVVFLMLLFGPRQVAQLWLEPTETTVVGSLETLDYRRAVWPWALAATSDFSITGVGLGSFRRVVTRLYPLDLPPEADIGHAHNIFLQTAVDIGVPGLVIYVAILFLAVFIAWRVAATDHTWRPLSLGLLASLCAFHIYGLVDALALGSRPSLLLWGVLALLSVSHRLSLNALARS